jgi:hypothetical protein
LKAQSFEAAVAVTERPIQQCIDGDRGAEVGHYLGCSGIVPANSTRLFLLKADTLYASRSARTWTESIG